MTEPPPPEALRPAVEFGGPVRALSPDVTLEKMRAAARKAKKARIARAKSRTRAARGAAVDGFVADMQRRAADEVGGLD